MLKINTVSPLIKKITFLMLSILLVGNLKATHVAGGEIYYRCVGDNGTTVDYEITLNVYRDCGGAGMTTTGVLNQLNSATAPTTAFGSINGNFRIIASNNCTGASVPSRPYSFVSTNSGTEITQVCGGFSTECSTPAGSLPGIEFFQFKDTISFPKTCNEWKIQYWNFARNSSDNLVSAGSANILIEATLNTTDPIGACNSSPQFLADPSPFVCLNDTITVSYNAVDPDGDSLDFRLVDAERLVEISGVLTTVPMNYDSTYSASKPINFMEPYDLNTYINPNNGDITFAPNLTGSYVFCVEVTEYNRSNGGIKGKIRRDYQIVSSIQGCLGANEAPTPESPGLKNANSLGTIVDSITIATVPANDTLCFQFSFEDINATDTVTIESNIASALGNGASINVTGINPVTAEVCWPLNGISPGNYPLLLTGIDNNCPFGAKSSASITIQVNEDVTPTGFTQIEESCPGAGDGGFQAEFSGGLGPFSFLWYESPNGIPGSFVLLPNDTNQIFQSPTPGRFYQFRVVDKGTGLTSVASSFVMTFVGSSGILIQNDTILRPNCSDLCGTSIEIQSLLGGTVLPDTVTSYQFEWLNSADSVVDTTNHAKDLCPGVYRVRISDDNGCDTVYSYTLSTPATFNAQFTDVIDIACKGDSTGTLVLKGSEASCGVLDQLCQPADLTTDSIDTGTLNGANLFEFPSAFPAAGQKVRQQFLYRANELKAIGFSKGKISGINFKIGGFFSSIPNFSILMTCTSQDSLNDWVFGASEVFESKSVLNDNAGNWKTFSFDRSFQWDGVSNIIIEICTEVPSNSINQPTQLNTTSFPSSLVYASDTSDACGASQISTSPIQFGINSFTIENFKRPDIIFRYCEVGYTYEWSHNATLTDTIAENLSVGAYSGYVSNEDGCRDTVTTSISEPDSAFRVILTDSIPLTCFGDTNGSATISPLHGKGPYTFNWTPPIIESDSTDSVATNLRANTNYNVEVTDSNSCVANVSFSIGEREQLDPTHTVLQNIVCAGDTQGVVQITPTIGVAPFSYQWSPNVIFGAGGDSVGINIKGGITYRVTVTDGNGCVDSTSFTLPAPLGIQPQEVLNQDVRCFGEANGVVGILPTNGLAPYVYTWPTGITSVNNGDSTRATNLSAGISYKVYVEDANTCQDSITVSVSEPPLLTMDFTDSTDANCFNGSDGTATVFAQGGTRPFNYSWEHDGTVTDSLATNLPAGRFTVTVTDDKGCEAQDSVNIDEPGASVIVSIDSIYDVSCNGLADGFLRSNPSGGTRPYSLQWRTLTGPIAGQNDSTISNRSVGTYIISVTDNQGCTASDTAILSQPAVLQVNVVDTQMVSCSGDNDGLIRVTPQGGTAPFTYQWNDPLNQTDSIADGLAGSVTGISYQVILSDSGGRCQDSASVSIFAPTALSINKADSSNITCYNAGNGSARITVSGGSPSYNYLWDDPSNTTDSLLSNLIPGTYQVVVTDQNNCSDSTQFFIQQPDSSIFGSFSNTDSVSCSGSANGSATFRAKGGTEPYTYNWSGGTGGGSDSTTNNLSAGLVFVTITDDNGCPAFADSVEIFEPDPLSGSLVNLINAGCNGGNNGSATARVTGGIQPYTYAWLSGSGGALDSITNGLSAGLISVTVVSSGDPFCQLVLNDTIDQNTPIQIAVDSTANVECAGQSNGFIQVSATGGYGVYIYSWSHNGALTDSAASNLTAQSYLISVTDTANCPSADTTITISSPTPINITKADSGNVSCFGAADGFARVTVSGGTPGYSFLWNDALNTTDSLVSTLDGGTYKVIVSDANSCADSATVSITEPGQSVFTTTSILNGPSCAGFTDGSVKVSPTGGTPPYSYTWSHDGALNDSVAAGLGANTYIVEVRDDNNCSAGLDTIVLTEPNTLQATLNIDSNVTCNAFSNGGMSVTGISGGTEPYTFLWSGGSPPLTDSVITGLSAGGYEVTITDSNGCFITLTDTIVQPTPLTGIAIPPVLPGFSYLGDFQDEHIYFSAAQLNWDQARQAALNVGGDLLIIKDSVSNAFYSSVFPITSWIGLFQDTSAVTYTEPSGGWFWVDGTPLTYSNWSPGEPNNLGPEDHAHYWDASGGWNDIRGTDTYQFGIWIKKGGKFSQNASCNGLNDGFISFDAGGGVPPYSYAWSNGDLDSLAENLDSGRYVVTITDANNCTLLDTTFITEPAEFIATMVDSSDETCLGNGDGSARVTWTGGSGSVSYQWSNADNDSIAENLIAGSYGVLLTDANGCADSVFVTIQAGDSVVINSTKLSDVNCFGNNNGSVKAIASGGSTPYTYNWSKGTVSNDTLVTGLNGGNVVLEVIDNSGCSRSDTIFINEPTAISITASLDSLPTCLDSNGQITARVSGGIPFSSLPYRYTWLNQGGDTLIPQPADSVATGLNAQNYQVIIEDSNGCVENQVIPLNAIDGPIITLDSQVDVVCDGDSTGSIAISVTGAGPFNYLWLPDSATGEDISDLDSGQYVVVVTDTNDCPASRTFDVDDGDLFTILDSSIQVQCNGDSNGLALVSILGTSGPFSYNWSAGNTFVPIAPPIPIDSARMDLPPGYVFVEVTDGRGCTQLDSIFVPEPASLEDTLIQTSTINCFGDASGEIVARVSGGTGSYFYSWSNNPGFTKHDSIQTNLIAGTYSVTITDTLNCGPILDTIIITQPDSLSAVETGSSNLSCFGATDGMFSIQVFGGSQPYTYNWSAGNGGLNDSVSANIDTNFVAVTVTDAAGCNPIVISKSLIEPAPISISLSKQDVSCFNQNDGIVSALVTGGNGGYQFLWSAGTGGVNDTATSGLDSGKVIVNITDSQGCPAAIDSIIVNQPDTFVASFIQTNDVLCNGDSTGSATVAWQGGNGGVTYIWSHIGSPTDSIETNLYADTFGVLLTDIRGCQAVAATIVNQPDSLTIQFSDVQDPQCFGFGNGSVTANVSGGTLPYTYNWAFGSAGTADSINTNLFAGTIPIIIEDDNGCEVSGAAVLNEPAELMVSLTIDSLPSCALTNGGASATVSGGTPFSGNPYQLEWLDDQKQGFIPSQSDTFITGIGQGIYFFAVEDSAGCVDTSQLNLPAQDGPDVYLDSISNVTCIGFSNGAIFVSDSSGNGALTYSWSPGSSTNQDLINVSAGSYTLIAEDTLGCQDFLTENISEPSPISVSFDSTLETCLGNDASATAHVSGGTAPYNFSWQSGLTGLNDSIVTGLSAGFETLSIIDSNSCLFVDSVLINTVPPLQVTFTDSGDVSCFGGTNGFGAIQVTGGLTPYLINWSGGNGSTTDTISENVSPGVLSVSVTDAQGCPPLVSSITIGEPQEILVSFDTTQATCGLANGQIIAGVTGGTAPYSLTWLDNGLNPIGQTGDTASNLGAGNYVLRVIDNQLCSNDFNVGLNSIGGPIISLNSITNATSNGACDGGIDINISTSGSGIQTILWTPGNDTTEDISGKCAGIYNVVVTDSAGCISTFSDTIKEPPVGPALITSTGFNSTNCDTSICDGRVFVNVTSGTPPFQYAWSTSSTDTLFEALGLCAGTYTVTVTDSVGNTLVDTAVIPLPSFIQSINPLVKGVNCNGGGDGSIVLSPAGGQLPYTYNWAHNLSLNNDTALSLTAGGYLITVTEASGCTFEDSIIVSEPSPLQTFLNTSNTVCTQSNGTAKVTVSGGSPGYTYLWLNSGKNPITPVQNSDSISNLASGIYYVAVADTNGCVDTGTASIIDLGGPIITLVSKTNASFPSVCDGAFDMTITPQFSGIDSILWTPTGSTTEDVTGLCAGIYNLRVVDSLGCKAFYVDTIFEPASAAPLTINTTAQNSNCNPSICDGEVKAFVSGGYMPYTYTWSTNPGVPTSVDSISNLCGGTYFVTVTDSINQTILDTIDVLLTPAIDSIVVEEIIPSCSNSSDGSLVVRTKGGAKPYSFSWSHNATLNDSIALNLPSGNYVVTVTEAGGCDFVDSLTLVGPPAISVSFDTTLASCGVSDGKIVAFVSGGLPSTSGFQYEWLDNGLNPLVPAQTADSVINLAAGFYNVEITDSTCTDTFGVGLSNFGAATITLNNKIPPSCFGFSDGSIDVNINGGTAPFIYDWNGVVSQTEDTNNIPAGIYTLQVVDSNSCISTFTDTLTQPSAILLTSTVSQPSCIGVSNGNISLTLSGGTPGYQVQWLPGLQTTLALTNLDTGSYIANITDTNGCVAADTFNLFYQNNLTIQPAVINDLSCFNTADGSATAFVTGGTIPLNYVWSNGETSDTALALDSGINQVTVSDVFGCSIDTTIFITAPPSIVLDSVTLTQPNCGVCNGVLLASVSGGTGSLSYLWNTGDTTSGLSNLCAGNYSLTVTDANGCSESFILPLSDIGGPIISKSVTPALCQGQCNGTAKVNVLSGQGPFAFNWPTLFNITDTVSGLCAGVYPVEVTDSVGCKSVDTIQINEPPVLTVSFSKTFPTCGDSNGVVSATINGGVPFNSGYTLLWLSNSGIPYQPLNTTDTLQNLTSGIYKLAVGDSNSCGGIYDVTLPNNIQPTITIDSVVNASCIGVCDGEAYISTVGSGPFNYLWTPSGQTTQDAFNLCVGTYSVQVTDANNCKGIQQVTIQEDIVINSTITVLSQVSCYNACNAEAEANTVGANLPLTYLWSNGEQTKKAVQLCAGKNYVTITDAFGCSIVDSTFIQSPSEIKIDSLDVTQPSCGLTNGSIRVYLSGGVGQLTYVWSNNQNTALATGLGAGSYQLSVFDQNGCIKSFVIPLSNNQAPTFTDTTSRVSCNGNCDGSITIQNLNGNAPFNVQWPQINGTGLTQNSLCAGLYDVMITDSIGCVATDTIRVKEPKAITASFQEMFANCGQSDGSLQATVVGGTPGGNGYTYFWLSDSLTPLIPFQNQATVQNIPAGKYNLRVSDSLGCQQIIPTTLSDQQGPTITLENIEHSSCVGVCDGEILTRVIGASSIIWIPTGQTTDDIFGLCAGNYTIEVEDTAGCKSFANYDVYGVQAINTLVSSKTNSSCSNTNDGEVTVQLVGGTAPINYNWTGPNGFTSPQEDITNLYFGEYQLVVEDNIGCTDTLVSTIFTDQFLNVDAGKDTLICLGVDSANIVGAGIPNNLLLQWYDEVGNPIGNDLTVTVPERPGSFIYYLYGTIGTCIAIDTVRVQTSILQGLEPGLDRTIELGSSTTLGGNPTAPAGSNFSWEPFNVVNDETSPNPVVSPNETTRFYVTATNELGCIATDSVLVTVDLPFIVNDGFTPNGDGVNDLWVIDELKDYPQAEVEIYTRWGQLVYQSPVPYVEWDGTLNGEDLPVGTYYYVIKLNDGENTDPITGPLTIVK